jgi:hypothetical protein
MKIKEGANIAGLQLPMREVLIKADKIWSLFREELVITSGLDGEHSAGSLHYYGYAVDLRSRYFTEGEKTSVVERLKEDLGSDYHVVAHKTHIHVEYEKVLAE